MASHALTVPFQRQVMGWSALLKADLVALSRSWVLRGWIVVLALTEFFALAGLLSANRVVPIPGSQLLALQLQMFLVVWSTVIIVLSAGSVSLEADIIADGILSRACTRNQYILAKLAARAVTILGVYVLVAGVAGYCCYRYATNDMTIATIVTGIGIVGLAVLLLVSLGVAMSVVFNNTIFSVIGLLLLWYVAAPIFNFMGAEYLSPSSLQRNLPQMLKDSRAPQVVQCSATATSLTVTFSKDVNQEKAEQLDNYTILCPPQFGGAPTKTYVAKTATYDQAKTTVVLSGLDFPVGNALKVTVKGVTDTAGNEMSPAADFAKTTVTGKKNAKTDNDKNTKDTKKAKNEKKKDKKAKTADKEQSDSETAMEPESKSKTASEPSKRVMIYDRQPPHVLSCIATASSLKVAFSKEIEPKDAEQVKNYTIESPFNRTHTAKTAAYDEKARTVLLSGLHFAGGDPVKVTVKRVRGLNGVAIAARGNSATYTDVTTWKYVLGFGVPTLLFALLAIAWFSQRDL